VAALKVVEMEEVKVEVLWVEYLEDEMVVGKMVEKVVE